MTELYIIRHGEAYSNIPPYSMGGEKSCKGLTERGFAQAEALAKRLKTGEIAIDVLYASTLLRASQTAEYVSDALGLPIQWERELHELRPGECDGMTYDEAREKYPTVTNFFDRLYQPLSPGGESWADFLLRGSTILEQIVRAHQGKRIAVVAHGGIVEVSFMYLLGLGPQTRMRNAFHIRNTAITHWRQVAIHERREWQLICHNDHAHLRDTNL
jgi:2,3-bisphosphoglycerate-dependent phosphoglycerate mutase